MATLARIVLMLPLASIRIHAVRTEDLERLAHPKYDLDTVQEALKESSFRDKEKFLEDLRMPPNSSDHDQRTKYEDEEFSFGILLSSLEEENETVSDQNSEGVFLKLKGYLEENTPWLWPSAGRMLAKLVRYEFKRDPKCTRRWHKWANQLDAGDFWPRLNETEREEVKKIYGDCKVSAH
mmetsp:Transcript_56985/g.132887  ORF Transcript_56985/g.132887 Transcript_56985/m.132887 type:complete len:180 (+) Transcript_56985:61-600(+)|eukprot:CAMPEP_0171100604 /NCGR_PEP_ID=MMETSP0766_2-20121228/53055_1 /TAXON_ID=439317 /ORGANISM="Gambierdiscus australes, Strain CAWD 149" /LENGTH=179 /DNA_ID=CAMNT_0011560459 /DNA_START=61 /DNA_END=600 /DNA_ORIENTATION=+